MRAKGSTGPETPKTLKKNEKKKVPLGVGPKRKTDSKVAKNSLFPFVAFSLLFGCFSTT